MVPTLFFSQMAGILSSGVTWSEWEHLSEVGVRTPWGSKAVAVEDQWQRGEEALGQHQYNLMDSWRWGTGWWHSIPKSSSVLCDFGQVPSLSGSKVSWLKGPWRSP